LTIKKCCLLFLRKELFFIDKPKNLIILKVALSVVVQRMVQSEKSGIAFSIDPVTNDKNKMVMKQSLAWGNT
jgi:phosphoenolpyruvate synthase/pyruvate phosphate dikinase